MATSGHRPPSNSTVPKVTHRGIAVSRYDLVLMIVPLALALAATAGLLAPVSLHASLAVGASVAAVAVVDALFFSPPGDGSNRRAGG